MQAHNTSYLKLDNKSINSATETKNFKFFLQHLKWQIMISAT